MRLVTYYVYAYVMNDNYIRAADVHAPKLHWTLIHVLQDGGEATSLNESPSSLAIGRWDNKPALGMRWNGNGDNPLGNPQSRGLPTWFIVPEQYWKPILETGLRRVSDDTTEFARKFLEMEREYFLTRCPNPACKDFQKTVICSYRTNEIGDVLEKIRLDDLKFYHIICDFSWEPSQDEKVGLTAALKAAWENRRGLAQ